MKITGQILKENRERKGVTIAEVAVATKINNKTLIAMEEGNLDALPPKTFLRGFVRSYASYLGLDVDSVLNTFFEEMGTTKPKPTIPQGEQVETTGENAEPVAVRPPPRPRPPGTDADGAINPKASTTVKVGAVGGILVLVIAIFLFKSKMESYEKEAVVDGVPPNIESLSKDQDVTSKGDTGVNAAGGSGSEAGGPGSTPVNPTPSPDPAIAVIPPKPSATATPTPTPSPSPVATPTPKATATPKPSPSATPKTTPTPTATPKPSPTATPKPSPSATATPTPKPSVTPKPSPSPTASPAAKAQEIILEAMDNVDVDAQIDGEPTRKFHLKADQLQTIKAKRKVVLRLSNGGAVNLIVNGADRGVPGDLGKPARIELP